MITPEFAGMRTVLRTAWPPALAVLGTLPVLVARIVSATRPRRRRRPLPAPLTVLVPVLVLCVLVGGWVRFREEIHALVAAAHEVGQPDRAWPNVRRPGRRPTTTMTSDRG